MFQSLLLASFLAIQGESFPLFGTRTAQQHNRQEHTSIFPAIQNYGQSRLDNNLIKLQNVYDDWRSDAVVDIMVLDEENVQQCLDEFVYSTYGEQMFGVHDVPASYGITGTIELVEVCGPEVILRLEGNFWHARSHVLGRAAVWLNSRMPEITDVTVEDMDELNDFEEVRDEFTGDIIETIDRRAPDFNGDRTTMEYQGLDPNVRGPFPQGVFGSGGPMINPM
jgi:hypothetical protein